MKIILILVAGVTLLFQRQAHAYLDPGSGSVLVSAIIAFIAVIVFFLKDFFYNKLKLFGRKTDLPDLSREYDIVVYSEGKHYWNVFFPVLEILDKRDQSVVYFTSHKDDPGLSHPFSSIETKFIGASHQAYYVLNRLKANVLVMTTPGVGVLQIKRVPTVKHYCHVTHALGSVGRYKAHGLDYYDSVLLGGNADLANIRELEQTRNTKKKQIEIVGCTYLDVLRARLRDGDVQPYPFSEKKTMILLSPTWGNHGTLSKFGAKVLKTLSSQPDFNLIIRPHPQSFVSEVDLMEDLMESFPDGERVRWDTDKDGLNSMYHADIMISDFSGIIFDFVLLFQRPVLSFRAQFEKRGRDAMDLKGELLEMTFLDKIGGTLDKGDISSLPDRIRTVLNDQSNFGEIVDQVANAFAQYPGEAGKRAADFICGIKHGANDT